MYRRIRQVLGLAGGALAAFHGWLFAAQAASGELGDPLLVARWILAAALIAALAGLRRRGHSLWGRKGIAIWILAALLHGPALTATAEGDFVAPPEAVASTVLQSLSAATLVGALWMLARRRRARACIGRLASAFSFDDRVSATLAAGVLHQHFSRPPPLYV